jgi:hypothetical protein
MQATNPKNNAALSNLLAAALSVAGFLTVPYSPWFVGIPVCSLSSFMAVTTAIRHKKYQLTTLDYWSEWEAFCSEGEEGVEPVVRWLFKTSTPLVEKYVTPKIPPIALTLLDAASTQKDDSWLTQKLIRASKFVLGGKGTGKSEWIRYEARRFKAENATGIIRIIDLHSLDDPDSEWLPGLDPTTYLFTTVDQGMAAVRELIQIGRDRIASKSTDHLEYKLIIDEFQAFRNRASDEDKKLIDEAIQFSQDELRKFKVNVTLTSKSRKKGMTGQDSSVIDQMDFMALGNSIADPNNVLPYDINAKELTAKRQAAAALPGCKYACIYRPMDGEAEIKIVPDDLPQRSACITFAQLEDELTEDEIWLESQLDFIAQMVQAGASKNSIYKQLGVRKGSNSARYLLVHNLLSNTPMSARNSAPGTSAV